MNHRKPDATPAPSRPPRPTNSLLPPRCTGRPYQTRELPANRCYTEPVTPEEYERRKKSLDDRIEFIDATLRETNIFLIALSLMLGLPVLAGIVAVIIAWAR